MRTTPWLTTALLLGLAAPATAQHGEPHKPHTPHGQHEGHRHDPHGSHLHRLHEHLMRLHHLVHDVAHHSVRKLHEHLMILHGHEAHGAFKAHDAGTRNAGMLMRRAYECIGEHADAVIRRLIEMHQAQQRAAADSTSIRTRAAPGGRSWR